MPLYQPPLKSTQVYSTANVTANRTYDPTATTTAQTQQTLATLIADLKAAGLLS